MQTGHEAGRGDGLRAGAPDCGPPLPRPNVSNRSAGEQVSDVGPTVSFIRPLVRHCGERWRSVEDLAVTSREPDAELLF